MDLYHVQSPNKTYIKEFNFEGQDAWISCVTGLNRNKEDIVTKVLSTDEFRSGNDKFKIMNVKYVRELNTEIGEEPDL